MAPEVEEAVIAFAYEQPSYGQLRASNELRKRGILVSAGGVRSIWLRNNLETFDKRLKVLEEKAAKEGIVYTEAQLARASHLVSQYSIWDIESEYYSITYPWSLS